MMNQQNSSIGATTSTMPAIRSSYVPACRDDESAEIVYAEQIAKSATIAAEEGVLYCWTGDHWQAQEDVKNLRHALKWLSQFDRKRANKAAAKSCIETAMLYAQELRPKPHRAIIPLHGVWLVLDDDYQLIATEPDREFGVCHTINATIPTKSGAHMPQAVPVNSLFGKYLQTSLPNVKVRELVQEYVGYTLTGSTEFQTAQFWVGSGSNGKSVLLNVVRALHAKPVAMELDKLDGFARAAIVGASLIACDETPKGKINQQTLKKLISGGVVDVTPKYSQPFSYQPLAKWIICSNHIPALNDHSDGWWRRLHIIEWNVQVKGKNIIPNLDQRIIYDELHIVLDWALEGLQRLYKRGYFEIPEAVQLAKQEAMAESNSVHDWANVYGVAMPDESTPFIDKGYLYSTYVKYCDTNGYMACNLSQFFKRLKIIFPSMRTKKAVREVGKDRVRVPCVNLITGKFSDDEMQEIEQQEQAEIEALFSDTGHPADDILLINHPSRKPK
jgi:putative DNA primase/helicase